MIGMINSILWSGKSYSLFCLPDSSCKSETTELEIGSISQRHWPMEHFQIEHTQEQPRFQSGNSQRVFTLCLIDHNIMETIKNENKIKILKVAQNSLVICFHLSLQWTVCFGWPNWSSMWKSVLYDRKIFSVIGKE